MSGEDPRCRDCGSRYVEWVPEEDGYYCEECNPMEPDNA